ncbi:MAG: hypothetical protein COA79_16355 [Planctomycetota bacterium]|nr:MAG: hypothetical protein COA79_16355 [Planctomycetota bacterium]
MTIFPRKATPKDKYGFPHYEAIKEKNENYEKNYQKLLDQRVIDREKVFKKLKGEAKKKHLEKQKESIANLFSLTIKKTSSFKKSKTYLKVLFKTTISNKKNTIKKTVYGIYYNDIQVTTFQEFRATNITKPLKPILCLPSTGPSFTGIQSQTDLLNECGFDLALAGFSVILPELNSLVEISTTTNKKWIIKGSNSFSEALKELEPILSGIQLTPGIENLPIHVMGKEFGATLGIFLAIIDSRIQSLSINNPTFIEPTFTHESLLIPKFNQTADMNYLFALLFGKKILINNLSTLYNKSKIKLNKNVSLANGNNFIKSSIQLLRTQKISSPENKYFYHYKSKPERLFNISHIKTKSEWQKNRTKLDKKYRELLNIPNKPKAISINLISENKFKDHTRFEYHVQTSPNTMANMTIHKPINAAKKLPVILSLPGSGSDVAANYNRYAHEIVEKGWICVTIDARVAIYDFHPQIMEKTSLIAQGIYDILCCTDEVFKRNDVDTKRVACMGISQGGTHSWMLAALDQRIVASVPVCGTCTYKSVCEEQVTEYYGGSGKSFLDSHSIYYYIPDMMCYADQQDLCALIAPRNLTIIGGTYDNCFPLSGMREASKDLKHFYKIMGVSNNFKYIEFEGPHSIPPFARKKAYQFINSVFKKVK